MGEPNGGCVGVVGAGYVGLTSAACLARLGHRVRCVDIDSAKVRQLRRGVVEIEEPGLAELVAEGLAAGRLAFATELNALADADVVLLCLPTPAGADGAADLRMVESVLSRLSETLAERAVVVTKSTVPVGTAERARALLGRADVAVVSNPEFLREGHAVTDFLHPDRVVIGCADPEAGRRVARLYARLDAPVLTIATASAELAKYASNSFLALKVSYANELAELCELLGADIDQVAAVMGADGRIGPAGLRPGPGWGGSCLPKDTRALLHAAEAAGHRFDTLGAAVRGNAAQPARVVGKVRRLLGRPLAGARLGLLGLAFKAGTDDLRDSAALAVARLLAAEGAVLTGYDPAVPAHTADVAGVDAAVHVVDDPYLVAKDAHALILLTEWPQFHDLDWLQLAASTREANLVDARNALDPAALTAAGFHHVGLGRGR